MDIKNDVFISFKNLDMSTVFKREMPRLRPKCTLF